MVEYTTFQNQFSNFTLLGRGGQKNVYAAHHPLFGDVVVKFYFKLDDPRGLREIEIAKYHSFSNVPRLFETGTVLHEGAETLYTIEQRIVGTCLREKIDKGMLFSLKEAVSFLEQGLNFISCLEDHEIIHRDIKPENIIIQDDGAIFFLDFGIARVLNLPSLTQTEAVLGPHTPGYAAPEQFNNLKNDLDSRSDLFSLGVVTYECITGENPFRSGARSPLEILQKTETITPVAYTIEGDTQKQFMALLSSLMGKYPSRRPRDAKQALSWLAAAKPTLQYIN